MVILHDMKNEEGIRQFLMDVWESYVKVRFMDDGNIRGEPFNSSRQGSFLDTDCIEPFSYPNDTHRIAIV